MFPRTETVFKILPFLSGLAIVCGICKTVAFYSIFDISILPFLDFSETVLLFFGDLFFMIVIISGWSCFMYTFEIQEKPVGKNEKVISVKKLLTITVGILFVGAIIEILVSSLPKEYSIPSTLLKLAAIYGAIFLLWFLSRFWKRYEKDYNTSVPLFNKITAALIIFLFFYSLGSGLAEGLRIKHLKWKRVNCVAFLNNSRKIQTSDSIIFIGRTQNYTFFYNPKSEKKTVISNSDINEFKTQ
jgi:hypothetical protein